MHGLMNINSSMNTPYSLLKNEHLTRDHSQDITSLPHTHRQAAMCEILDCEFKAIYELVNRIVTTAIQWCTHWVCCN